MGQKRKQSVYDEPRVPLGGMLKEFRDAMEEEIAKIEKSGQSSTLLFEGKQIESNCGDFVQRGFQMQSVVVIDGDVQIRDGHTGVEVFEKIQITLPIVVGRALPQIALPTVL